MLRAVTQQLVRQGHRPREYVRFVRAQIHGESTAVREKNVKGSSMV